MSNFQHCIKGIAAVIQFDNIDTDQIIPADSLKTTQKLGLGKYLFANWRYQSNGSNNNNFVLNLAETKAAKILISGDNFGCGSSREHAAWALTDFGIKVIISSRIADIFKNNAIKNGLLPIEVSNDELRQLFLLNGNELEINLERQLILSKNMKVEFNLAAFTKYCFLNRLDELDYLLDKTNLIDRYEQRKNVL
ncbi:3-isopropylmalate dehydratase small subunit [Aliikangiella sp. IMCC44632]